MALVAAASAAVGLAAGLAFRVSERHQSAPVPNTEVTVPHGV